MKKAIKKSLIVSSLAVAVQGLLFASLGTVAYANTATPTKKAIGDLEIYQSVVGGNITLTMMLDTSGSMAPVITGQPKLGSNQSSDPSACDFGVPDRDADTPFNVEISNSDTTPSYQRWVCSTTVRERTYHYMSYGTAWFSCNEPTNCNGQTQLRGRPNIPAGAVIEYRGANREFALYYTVAAPRKVTNADRMTRLKDAIFLLMDSQDIDSKKTMMGVGQFSTQSDKTNKHIGPDNASGKIIVPAALLDNAQRLRIKQEVAKLIPGGGTPSASAYAEAGAYMLGTNTAAQGFTIEKEHYITWGSGSSKQTRLCTAHGAGSCSQYASTNTTIPNPSSYTVKRCRVFGADCYVKSETGSAVDLGFTGYAKSVQTTDMKSKNSNESNYVSPLPTTPNTCDGQGIYFLTDGFPNSSVEPEKLMKQALGTKGSGFTVPEAGNGTLPNGGSTGHGTPQVGAFAKALRIAANNPKNTSIRTAVVGFGSVFDTSKYANIQKNLKVPVLDKQTGMPKQPIKYQDKVATYFNCALIPGGDARNACNWGAKSHPDFPGVGGYGEGGFYSAQSTTDVVNSVKTFVNELKNEIGSAPSGTIHIPDDPYSVAGQQAVAYMPMIEPKVATKDMVWPGNMKKYHLKNGTIWGKNNQRLYTNIKGDLNASAQDGWSTSTADNNKVAIGGFYTHLKNPKGNRENVRQLFVEDFSGAGTTEADKKPKARKFGVNAQGRLTLDGNAISTSNKFHDTTTYTLETVKYLLHFLGFTNAKVGNNIYSLDEIPTGTALANIELQAPTEDIRVLGGSPHSTPTALSYGVELDARGNVSLVPRDRKDYVLFGSMDGALHLVDAHDSDESSTTGATTGGQEVFAFIPKVMLNTQLKALRRGMSHDKPDGQPVFGIDAPWAVFADYRFGKNKPEDKEPSKMELNTDNDKGLYAYGGFRLGGEGLYGLKLNNKDNPELAFVLTKDTITGLDNNNPIKPFERLGQIWAKPTKAKIKVNGQSQDVIIFGGGYDLCYENENFQIGATGETYTIDKNQRGEVCAGKTEAVGNAVYMVNAHTGALLWTAKNSLIKHSIVAGVNTIDRDNDGHLDAIYFADLGGQVFRADFDNSQNSSVVREKRIVRLLQPAGTGKFVRRFYEKPVVSIYRGDAQFTGGDSRDDDKRSNGAKFNQGGLFALVNVISGDRSNPTSTMRDIENADRLYGIYDVDIGKRNLYTMEDSELSIPANGVDGNNFENLSGLNGQDKKDQKLKIVKTKKGWYHPIIDFDGYTNVKYGKGIGKSEVIGSLLFSSVYNPDKKYSEVEDCVASIKGGTERQMYCLPYGICRNERSTNGKGGFSPAGQGISELTLGPIDGTAAGSRKRTLISNVGLNPDSSTGASRTDFGDGAENSNIPDTTGQENATKDGGMGSHPDIIADPRFTLQPLRWYDNSVKN